MPVLHLSEISLYMDSYIDIYKYNWTNMASTTAAATSLLLQILIELYY